jgi:hypothetical protein
VLARLGLRALCLASACCALACGPAGGDAATGEATTSDRRVVLGTGEAEFEPISGEPHLTLVAGVQGGFHVWASFLAYGFGAGRVGMMLTTSLDGIEGSSLVMHAQLPTRDALDGDGVPMRTFAGFPAQIKNARCANAERVRIELSLTDADGDEGSTEDVRFCIADVAAAYQLAACP